MILCRIGLDLRVPCLLHVRSDVPVPRGSTRPQAALRLGRLRASCQHVMVKMLVDWVNRTPEQRTLNQRAEASSPSRRAALNCGYTVFRLFFHVRFVSCSLVSFALGTPAVHFRPEWSRPAQIGDFAPVMDRKECRQRASSIYSVPSSGPPGRVPGRLPGAVPADLNQQVPRDHRQPGNRCRRPGPRPVRAHWAMACSEAVTAFDHRAMRSRSGNRPVSRHGLSTEPASEVHQGYIPGTFAP